MQQCPRSGRGNRWRRGRRYPLQAGAIGFWGNMVQAVTHIAPGLNVLLGLTFIVSFAGVTAPIAYLLGGIICLGVAIALDAGSPQEFTRRGRLLPLHQPHDRPALRLADDVAVLPVRPGRDRRRLRVHRLARARRAEGAERAASFPCGSSSPSSSLADDLHVVRNRRSAKGDADLRRSRSGVVAPTIADLDRQPGGFNFAPFNPGNIPSGERSVPASCPRSSRFGLRVGRAARRRDGEPEAEPAAPRSSARRSSSRSSTCS